MPHKNVILILTDQWRSDSTGYSGNPIVKTPNLDKLAAISASFSNAHTICPLCSPARGCLMTGLLPYENGVIDNLNVGGSSQLPLDESNPTWLTSAVSNGYRTGYFGKWHLGEWHAESKNITFSPSKNETISRPYRFAPEATPRGELLPSSSKGFRNPFFKHSADLFNNKLPFYGTCEDESNMLEYHVIKDATEFLSADEPSPWCVTVSFKGPHFPLSIPQPYDSMYDYKDMPLPRSLKDTFVNKPWFQNRHWWSSMKTELLTDDDWRKAIAHYYGYITYLDDLIGKILKIAQQNSHGLETQLIFTSDHGEMLGNHSRFDKGAYFYDDVMRVPLLVCPDINTAGSGAVFSEYCSTQDIAATLYSMTGTKFEKGRDLMSLINNTSTEQWRDEAFGIYQRYNCHSFEVRSITTPEYKYSYVPQDIDELYNLKADPLELNNLSDDYRYAHIKESLKRRLFEFMKQNNDPLLDENYVLPRAGQYVVNDKPIPE